MCSVSSDVWSVMYDVFIVSFDVWSVMYDVRNVVFFERFFVLKWGFFGVFCYFWGSKGSFFVL